MAAFRRVTLPLLMPGIMSGAALAFIVSFDDFTITQLVAGPGQTTLPLYIWNQIRRPMTPEINAISTDPLDGLDPVRLAVLPDRATSADKQRS